MQKVVPCLWFDGDTEEAAQFYVSLLPDPRIDRVLKSPTDTSTGPAGMVLTVEFTFAGTKYMGLNGGQQFPFTEAVSSYSRFRSTANISLKLTVFGLHLLMAEQKTEVACGWVKDRWELTWQIIPRRMIELLNDPNTGRARRAQEAIRQMVRIDIATIERAADGLIQKNNYPPPNH